MNPKTPETERDLRSNPDNPSAKPDKEKPAPMESELATKRMRELFHLLFADPTLPVEEIFSEGTKYPQLKKAKDSVCMIIELLVNQRELRWKDRAEDNEIPGLLEDDIRIIRNRLARAKKQKDEADSGPDKLKFAKLIKLLEKIIPRLVAGKLIRDIDFTEEEEALIKSLGDEDEGRDLFDTLDCHTSAKNIRKGKTFCRHCGFSEKNLLEQLTAFCKFVNPNITQEYIEGVLAQKTADDVADYSFFEEILKVRTTKKDADGEIIQNPTVLGEKGKGIKRKLRNVLKAMEHMPILSFPRALEIRKYLYEIYKNDYKDEDCQLPTKHIVEDMSTKYALRLPIKPNRFDIIEPVPDVEESKADAGKSPTAAGETEGRPKEPEFRLQLKTRAWVEIREKFEDEAGFLSGRLLPLLITDKEKFTVPRRELGAADDGKGVTPEQAVIKINKCGDFGVVRLGSMLLAMPSDLDPLWALVKAFKLDEEKNTAPYFLRCLRDAVDSLKALFPELAPTAEYMQEKFKRAKSLSEKSQAKKGDADVQKAAIDACMDYFSVPGIHYDSDSIVKIFDMLDELESAVPPKDRSIPAAIKEKIKIAEAEMAKENGDLHVAEMEMDRVYVISKAAVESGRKYFSRLIRSLKMLLQINLKQGRPGNAEVYLDEISRVMGREDLSNEQKGLCKIDGGALELAKGLLDEHMQKDEYEDVIRRAEIIIAAEPENAKAQSYLGYAHYAAGRYDEAARAYEKYLELDPENSEAKAGLAGCEAEIKRAEEDLKTGIKEQYAEMRALMDAETPDYDGIIAIADDIIAKKPSVRARNFKAYAHYMKGEFDLAIPVYEKLLRLKMPDDEKKGIYENLAYCYEQTGNFANAAMVYENYLALEPGNAEIAARQKAVFKKIKIK